MRTGIRALWAGGLVALALFFADAALGLSPGAEGTSQALYVGLYLFPAALCIARGGLIGRERWPWLAFGIGMVFWAGGYAHYFLALQDLETTPYPSITDALWLGFYLASFVAVMLLLRSRITDFRRSVWIDALIGALTLAAIAAALLIEPILESTGGSLAAVTTNLAYPLSTLLIIGLMLPVFALSRGRPGVSWWLIVTAWACQLGADTVYLYQAASGSYAPGTLLDAIPPAVMLLLAYAAWQAPERTGVVKYDGWPVVVIPSAFAVISLALMAYDSFHGVNDEATILATGVVILAFVRASTMFADQRALARSRELRARYESILGSAGEGIYGLDCRGHAVFANPVAAQMTGHSEAELIGQDLHRLVHHTRPDGQPYPAQECPVRRTLADGTVQRVSDELYFRKDGTSFPVEYTSTPIIEDEQVRGAVVVFKDISERRRAERERAELERRLHHSQRMEGIGQLAGGIAHDFNNFLAVILGYTVLAGERLPEGDPVREDIEEVHKAAERAAALTRQLLLFSRRELVEPQTLELNAVVADMQRLLQRTIGEHVELRTAFASGLPPIRADRSQLEQVVINLAVNARDAMPDGGTLTIETGRVELDQRAEGGGFVALRVADTGCGMEEEVAARALEPYFTTKPTGKGSGLGLATVYGIVKQSGGEIDLRSEPGRGTVIEIRLPATTREETGTLPPERRPEESLPTGSDATVLLVEDEPAVRELTRRILARHGLKVLSAGSPKEAIRVFENHGAPIDLLLTDVVMPDMSGGELAERIRSIQPDLPVLYMSGYSDEFISRHGAVDPRAVSLVKPFDAEALLASVRRPLGGLPPNE